MYTWTSITEEQVKWVGIDFDQTIADNSGHPDYTPQEPIEGAIEALQKLDSEGYKIVIYTARPWVDYMNIENYCKEYNIPVRRIICGKPFFKCIIDDKNVEFKGDWKKALEDVKSFT